MARDDNAYFGADQQVHDALTALDDERRRLGETTQAQNEQRTTIHAKDHSFSMTFDGRGDLVDLTFQGTKYRTMAPKELANLIVATLQKGRLEAIEKMAAAMQSPALAGLDLVGIATGKADPNKVLDALVAPFLENTPGQGRGQGSQGGSRG